MVDVHTHLQFHAFKKDWNEVIKKAFDAGVKIIINTGTSLESSIKAVELTKKYEELYAIVGIHPHHADKLKPDWDKKLEQIIESSEKILAIGEIGLDYYSYKSNGIVNPELQKKIFKRQIQLANKFDLPLQIHNRQAGDDILEILYKNKKMLHNPPGMFHCMSGDVMFLKKVLDLGFYVGFDGNITYDGIAKGESTSLPELVKNSPIDRIVTETDAPFLTPEPHRGSRNEPKHVIIVGEEIAKIKDIDISVVETQTTKNAKNIFKI